MGTPEARDPERLAIPEKAGTELRNHYRARAAAESRLVDYLAGLLNGLDIEPERLVGYDDETHELLLTPLD